jgi:hypothetical protein
MKWRARLICLGYLVQRKKGMRWGSKILERGLWVHELSSTTVRLAASGLALFSFVVIERRIIRTISLLSSSLFLNGSALCRLDTTIYHPPSFDSSRIKSSSNLSAFPHLLRFEYQFLSSFFFFGLPFPDISLKSLLILVIFGPLRKTQSQFHRRLHRWHRHRRHL